MKAILDVTPIFKVGDPCPDGYVARSEWAQVHLNAGLRQQRCGSCFLWYFPHEMNPEVFVTMAAHTKHGPRNVRLEHRLCIECHKKNHE